jgi:heat shock protein HspQ
MGLATTMTHCTGLLHQPGLYVRQSRDGVRFRVGQVFTHKQYGYRGLIIGWDAKANAPPEWFKKMGVSATQQAKPM